MEIFISISARIGEIGDDILMYRPSLFLQDT